MSRVKLKSKELEDCGCEKFILSVQDAMDALSGRWKLPILIVLRNGTKRFNEISKEVTGITDKVLAKELRELEAHKLITRTVHETFPPRVEYNITPHGKSLDDVLVSLQSWGISHRQTVMV